MNRSATATVSTLGTVHAGFDRDEETIIDGLLDLSCEVDKAARKQYKSRESQYGDDDDYD